MIVFQEHNNYLILKRRFLINKRGSHFLYTSYLVEKVGFPSFLSKKLYYLVIYFHENSPVNVELIMLLKYDIQWLLSLPIRVDLMYLFKISPSRKNGQTLNICTDRHRILILVLEIAGL